MSGPLELYRTTVNVRGLGAGTQIEIDPTDEGWAGDISSRRIVPVRVVGPAPVEVAPGVTIQGESYYDDDESPIVPLVVRGAISETYLSDLDDDPVSDLDDDPRERLVDRPTDRWPPAAPRGGWGQIDRDLTARDD